MTTTETGGNAFPATGYDAGGLTIRDYFAAKAMQGQRASEYSFMAPEDAAIEAYQVADAMLQCRKSDSDREAEKAKDSLIAFSCDMLDALYRAKTALTFADQTSDAMKDDLKAIEAVIALATGNIAQ